MRSLPTRVDFPSARVRHFTMRIVNRCGDDRWPVMAVLVVLDEFGPHQQAFECEFSMS